MTPCPKPSCFVWGAGIRVMDSAYGLMPPPGAEEFAGRASSTLVLHLHGSLCIRTSEYATGRKLGQALAMLAKRDIPKYTFDPSSISTNFAPFVRDAGADDVKDRIIAPVPDKSQGLKEERSSATRTPRLTP
jgi:hypothetical protein